MSRHEAKRIGTGYSGFFTISIVEVTRTAEDGTVTTFQRELFERGHAAAVLIYDHEADKVLLVREFRVGNFGAGLPERLWADLSPVAGMIDKNETPGETAVREAREETGLDVTTFRMIDNMTVLPSPGGSSETISLFLLGGDLSGVETATFGVVSEGEETTREVWDRETALALLRSGDPVNGNMATLLLMLERALYEGRT